MKVKSQPHIGICYDTNSAWFQHFYSIEIIASIVDEMSGKADPHIQISCLFSLVIHTSRQWNRYSPCIPRLHIWLQSVFSFCLYSLYRRHHNVLYSLQGHMDGGRQIFAICYLALQDSWTKERKYRSFPSSRGQTEFHWNRSQVDGRTIMETSYICSQHSAAFGCTENNVGHFRWTRDSALYPKWVGWDIDCLLYCHISRVY